MALRSHYALIPASLFVLSILLWHAGAPAQAPDTLNVVTTSTRLASLVTTIGGDAVRVESLTKATENPHTIEAKPEYLTPLNRADLLVENGLGLEANWIERLALNTTNPNIQKGQMGRLNTSQGISVAVESEALNGERDPTRLHPLGNPPFTLDPNKAIEVADSIRERLSLLRPEQEAQFTHRFEAFNDELRAFGRRQETGLRGLPKAQRKIASSSRTWE